MVPRGHYELIVVTFNQTKVAKAATMVELSCSVYAEGTSFLVHCPRNAKGDDLYNALFARLQRRDLYEPLHPGRFTLFLAKSTADGKWLPKTNDTKDQLVNGSIDLRQFAEISETDAIDELLGRDFARRRAEIHVLVVIHRRSVEYLTCIVCGEDCEFVLEFAILPHTSGYNLYTAMVARLQARGTKYQQITDSDLTLFLTKSSVDGEWLTNTDDANARVRAQQISLGQYTKISQAQPLYKLVHDGEMWKNWKIIHVLVVVESKARYQWTQSNSILRVQPSVEVESFVAPYKEVAETLKYAAEVEQLVAAIDYTAKDTVRKPFIVLESSSGTGKTQMAFNLAARDDLDVFYLVCSQGAYTRQQPVYRSVVHRSRTFLQCIHQDVEMMGIGDGVDLLHRCLHTFEFVRAMLNGEEVMSTTPCSFLQVQPLLTAPSKRPVVFLDEFPALQADRDPAEMLRLRFMYTVFRAMGIPVILSSTGGTARELLAMSEFSKDHDGAAWCVLFPTMPRFQAVERRDNDTERTEQHGASPSSVSIAGGQDSLPAASVLELVHKGSSDDAVCEPAPVELRGGGLRCGHAVELDEDVADGQRQAVLLPRDHKRQHAAEARTLARDVVENVAVVVLVREVLGRDHVVENEDARGRAERCVGASHRNSNSTVPSPSAWEEISRDIVTVASSMPQLTVGHGMASLARHSRPLFARFALEDMRDHSVPQSDEQVIAYVDAMAKRLDDKCRRWKRSYPAMYEAGQVCLFLSASYHGEMSKCLVHCHYARLEESTPFELRVVGDQLEKWSIVSTANGELVSTRPTDSHGWQCRNVFPAVGEDVLLYLSLLGGKNHSAFLSVEGEPLPFSVALERVEASSPSASFDFKNIHQNTNDGMRLEAMATAAIVAASHANGVAGIALHEFLPAMAYHLGMPSLIGQQSWSSVLPRQLADVEVPFLAPPDRYWPLGLPPALKLGSFTRTVNKDRIEWRVGDGWFTGECKDYGTAMPLDVMKAVLTRIKSDCKVHVVVTNKLRGSYFRDASFAQFVSTDCLRLKQTLVYQLLDGNLREIKGMENTERSFSPPNRVVLFFARFPERDKRTGAENSVDDGVETVEIDGDELMAHDRGDEEQLPTPRAQRRRLDII